MEYKLLWLFTRHRKRYFKYYDNSNNFTGCLNFYEVEFNFVSINSTNGLCEDTVNIVKAKD